MLLQAVMRIWQKHEGAARMMLWLLFKTKVGRLQPIAVSTLMTVAYGSAKLRRSETDRAYRKKQIRTFEKDLEVLHEYHFDAVFDPNSYPPDIQPLWAKLLAVPEESEAEFEFWVDDAGKERRLTDPSPRGKWSRLMKARILQFQLPSDLDRGLSQLQKQQQRKSRRTSGMPDPIPLSPEQIAQFRRLKGWSQRELARQIGKSQSWVRDVEKGRLRVKPEDGRRLQELLDSEGFEASP
ncbi:helix-turn-helix domain-containing protein [Baaleninema sp.]|uniref:helix-turn-helix domain-containing protein n=1 Tax=Baaleninema sp. TaxID=3101197 RepID=UPI003D08CF93